MRNLFVTLILTCLISCLSYGFTPKNKAALNLAVSHYHQGNYSLACTELDSLRNQANATHRDSITLYQYLGMASTQAGLDSNAVQYFSLLIQIDSLFQFPRNEDPRILQNFSRALQIPAASKIGLLATPLPTSNMENQNLNPSLNQTLPKPASIILPSSTNKIGFTYGAIPLGGGWIMQNKNVKGWTLGLLQVTGLALSIYASEMQSDLQNDFDAIQNNAEKTTLKQWQWTQRISLSTALGTYLYSIFSALGD